MATFLDGVNRLLRINIIISGDSDDITTFSDTQHAADISRAQIAIQSELADLISNRLIPYEKTNANITLVSGTRSYALENDFIRFFGTHPSFLDTTDKVRIYEYPGGENVLMNIDYNYKTNTGTPIKWYWDRTTTKKVAFYNVPSTAYNGHVLSYEYEKSVMVSDAVDTLPFHNNEEFFSFIDMAARRFEFLRSKQPVGLLTQDGTHIDAKSRLVDLMKGTNPPGYYGKSYG